MQADEFEKKIRETMEGFALAPNSNVWEEVSLRIKKEKSRRKVLLYWLFIGLGMLAGTATWYFLHNPIKTRQVLTRNNSNAENDRNNHMNQSRQESASTDHKIKKLQEKTFIDISKTERKRVVKSKFAT